MSDQDLSKLKVAELREMLKEKGLNAVGNKQELIERLQAAVSESSGELNEDDLLNDDELDEEKSLLDSTVDDILKSPSESVKSTSPETPQPAKKISLKRNISIIVPIAESKPSDDEEKEAKSAEASGDEPDKKVVKISVLTEKERLELRAKKFAASQAASSERLEARAARFGITTIAADKTSDKLAVTKTAVSDEVLKKRAERFGTIAAPEVTKSELQEKLTKRQERFGASEKVAITAPTTATSKEYADKAQKRLERFKTAA